MGIRVQDISEIGQTLCAGSRSDSKVVWHLSIPGKSE